MKKCISLIFIILFLKADIISDFLKKDYKTICNYKNINKYSINEKALSIIGLSCVKTDNLYLLPYVVRKLKNTDYGRKNSIYFLTIYMEKKLLYSYLFDRFDLNNFDFPMTDYVLSKIFKAIKNKNYTKLNNKYIIKGDDIIYQFYKSKDKMFIDSYKNGKLIKRRWYK